MSIDTGGSAVAVQTHQLSKYYPARRQDTEVRAVDGVSIALEQDRVHGLLGRNGAGKSTLMKLITAQLFATEGSVRVFGADPMENPDVLSRTCFVQESQTYPDQMTGRQLLAVAAGLYPRWDPGYAASLTDLFELPVQRRITKMSRGQRSAVGIIMGLASRAELTLFDEPYLGLDAVARAAFFDALLADVAERPRTVLLSTHHIDEAADLLERVVVLDRGKVVVDEEADALRAQAYEVSGRAAAVAEFTEARDVTELRKLGALATASVRGVLTTQDRQRAEHLQLELAPVSLQALFVHLVQDEGSSRSGGTPSEPDLGSSSEADASTTSRTLGRSRS